VYWIKPHLCNQIGDSETYVTIGNIKKEGFKLFSNSTLPFIDINKYRNDLLINNQTVYNSFLI
jgi:hypothetical protein